MREKLAWLAFVLLVALTVRGFVQEGLHPAQVWAPEGWPRFAIYTGGFALWTLGFWVIRRSALFPATVLVAAVYAIGWVGIAATLTPIVFLGSCWLLGTAIAPRAQRWLPMLFGLAAWIFVLSLTIGLPIHTRPLYFVAVALPYLLGWRRIRRFTVPLPTAATALLLFVLLAHLVVALKPETGADALAVHLAVPELIAHEGKWSFDYQRFTWALMPMGADWIYTAEYMLGGAAGARLLNVGLLVFLALMIRRTALRWASEPHATLAAALFVSTPLVQLVTGSLFVENLWTVILLGALLALLDGELLWAGALFGTGMAVKIGTAAFLAPAILAGLALAIRQKKGRQAAAALALAALLAAPTYVNAWHRTGNPVYPFLNHIFKAPSIDTVAPFQETRYREPLAWNTPYDLTFRTPKFFEGDKGGMGFQYLLLVLPAALLIRRRAQWILLAITLAAALTLYISQPNLRYLYPALALLSVPIALFPSPWILAAITALNLAFLPAAGYYHREFALPTKAAADAYEEIGFPQKKLIEYLNKNATGQPAAFFNGDPIAGFQGYAYTDQWHSYQYARRLDHWSTVADLRAEFDRLRIRYIVAPKSGKTRYPAVNQLLRPLLDAPLKTSGVLALFRLPEATPELPGNDDSPNPSIQFTGAWSHIADFPEAFRETLSYSNEPGSAATLTFYGTGIEYWHTRTYNRGIAAITIDGVLRARLDLYAPKTQWQTVWKLDGLDDTNHTIEIRVTGNKNPAAADSFVDIDRLVVASRGNARDPLNPSLRVDINLDSVQHPLQSEVEALLHRPRASAARRQR